MRILYRILPIVCIISFATAAEAQTGRLSKDDMQQMQKLNYFYRFLADYYVEELGLDRIVESAIVNTLSELDPHSTYITAEEANAVRESLDGEFCGIGIEYAVYRDTLVVVGTVSGSPASEAGMMSDDRIVAVDGESVIGIDRADVPRLLRGERGSKVSVDVVRRSSAPRSYTLIRDNIPLRSISSAYRDDDGIGYVKVGRFAKTTGEEFSRAVKSLGDIDGLILDLRGNGGGVLEQALAVAGNFLPAGALIVSTSGRGVGDKSYCAPKSGPLAEMPLVVLIDEESASASEIVAGAMQDWDRAVLIGRPSFGKGLVQRQVEFGDGSAMRLTVARYKTPSGRIIQRPYRNGHSSEYYRSHIERYRHADSLPRNDSLLYRTLKNNREVYGGGGIFPDIPIAADTVGLSDCMVRLVSSGTTGEYALSYATEHRDSLTALYPAVGDYDSSFDLPEDMAAELIATAAAHGMELDADAYSSEKESIEIYVKALIAERIYFDGAFHYVYNRHRDNAYAEAVRVLRHWKRSERSILHGR